MIVATLIDLKIQLCMICRIGVRRMSSLGPEVGVLLKDKAYGKSFVLGHLNKEK